MQTAGLEVGGVEYIETHDGKRYYFDINATSSYRADVSRDAGVEPIDELVTFLDRELAIASGATSVHAGAAELIAA